MSRKDKLPLYLSTPPRAPIDYKEYMNCQAILGQMSREDQMLLYLSTPPRAPIDYKEYLNCQAILGQMSREDQMLEVIKLFLFSTKMR